MINRKEFLGSAAALVAGVGAAVLQLGNAVERYEDWDTVLNRVIAHRNPAIAGISCHQYSYAEESTGWCVKESLPSDGLLKNGEAIHV